MGYYRFHSIATAVLLVLFYSAVTVFDIANGNCPEDETLAVPSPSPSSSPSPSPSSSFLDVLTDQDYDCPLPRSCQDWYNLGINKSCHYPIYPDGKSLKMVYCDMVGDHCDGKGGWTRIGYFNMLDSNATCPDGLHTHQYSILDHPLCKHDSEQWGGSCASLNYSSLGISYNEVCGRARGYQYDGAVAFNHGHLNIDDVYVNGISITHGHNPRQHIWTYANGLEEVLYSSDHRSCPCNTRFWRIPEPIALVGQHYYCESGLYTGEWYGRGLIIEDPLWDGENCNGHESACCTASPNMPWFYRQLGNSTQDSIETRFCSTGPFDFDLNPVELFELYIH